MTTALITGCSGFTGTYLETELKSQGYDVISLSSDLNDMPSLTEEVRQVDPAIVAHLAGVAYVGHKNTNAFYEVNLIGTHNLLSALYENSNKLSSILLASSANVYGNAAVDEISESTRTNPVNDYAVSKLAMENMAQLWFDKLPAFIVRPFNYTGIGQEEKFLIPKIVSHFKYKRPHIELGNLDVWREFGDVRSVASIYSKLLLESPTGKTINICTGKAYSLREVISMCEGITGHKIEIRVNPAFVRANEVRELKGSNQLLNDILDNNQPIPHSLEETLTWMLQN